jgi:hypothetical protein
LNLKKKFKKEKYAYTYTVRTCCNIKMEGQTPCTLSGFRHYSLILIANP